MAILNGKSLTLYAFYTEASSKVKRFNEPILSLNELHVPRVP